MTKDQELLEKVKTGATGIASMNDYKVQAAIDACKIILKEDYLGMVGWPEKTKPVEQKRTYDNYAPRPNDKGFKMAAKRDGTCNICTNPIAIGEDIYFKSGSGANHVACTDEAAKLVP
jgi:hypothetical protein